MQNAPITPKNVPNVPIVGGGEIPIIGEIKKTWTYAFHRANVPGIKNLETMIQRLLYAIFPPLPNGMIQILPVAGLAQSEEMAKRIKDNVIIYCKPEDLITPAELGIEFDFGNATDVVDMPLDSADNNAENA